VGLLLVGVAGPVAKGGVLAAGGGRMLHLGGPAARAPGDVGGERRSRLRPGAGQGAVFEYAGGVALMVVQALSDDAHLAHPLADGAGAGAATPVTAFLRAGAGELVAAGGAGGDPAAVQHVQ